jgi:hypothetical protein
MARCERKFALRVTRVRNSSRVWAKPWGPTWPPRHGERRRSVRGPARALS